MQDQRPQLTLSQGGQSLRSSPSLGQDSRIVKMSFQSAIGRGTSEKGVALVKLLFAA